MLKVRKSFQTQSDLDEYEAEAIHRELQRRHVQHRPSVRLIGRMLERHGTMVDANGLARPNGTPLGPLEVMMVRSGIEEKLELFLCVVLAVLFTMLALIVRRGNVLRRQLAASRAELLRREWQRGRRPAERCDLRC